MCDTALVDDWSDTYIPLSKERVLNQRFRHVASTVLTLIAVASMATAPADARRGGSFGSRGSRTYYAPRPTSGSPGYVAPVERSMTTRPMGQTDARYTPGFNQSGAYRARGSRFGGFGGGLLGGLVAGGLIGHFFGGGMGGGWGGSSGGGFLASLLQIAILGGIVWLVIGFFRRRSGYRDTPAAGNFSSSPDFASQPTSGPWGGLASAPRDADEGVDIEITPTDQQAFERLLIDVQDAFGREDYARLRALTTPEIMSYLSEELSQNATQGRRNEVSGTRLLDAEVSEAWHEAGGDYATIALRYESIDVMRDRSTNAIISGSSTMPSETIEYWTFLRHPGGPWKLSAIQES